MGVPNDRRVIFETSVVPQETYATTDTTVTLEEGMTAGRTGASYTDYRIDTTIGKKFGGKGSVDVTSDQGTELWTSMVSSRQTWDTFDENWDACSHTWNLESATVSVDDSLSVIRTGTDVIKFLYIKNLGTEECQLALVGGEPDILIPAGAAVSIRTASTVTADEVKVAVASGEDDTTIEYVIAI
tara:strand:+ start:1124 stop:1678 length:555 start_codon:yes stop_codon:yes gene_type:complete